jgi:hypothetical protein
LGVDNHKPTPLAHGKLHGKINFCAGVHTNLHGVGFPEDCCALPHTNLFCEENLNGIAKKPKPDTNDG